MNTTYQSPAWYAERVCQVLAHGGKRFTSEKTGWGDFLACWIYLTQESR